MHITGDLLGRRTNLNSRTAKQLFVHNLRVNGLKAIVYCYGLSASRYVEYASAISFLSLSAEQSSEILELGSGHSILPSFWQKMRFETLILDINRTALKWQAEKSRRSSSQTVGVILGDMRYLPFKDRSIGKISCVSAIEHIPGEGDVEAAVEMGRILKGDGVCVVSFPLSPYQQSCFKRHWATGIPVFLQRLFKVFLPTVLSKLGVDRTSSYFERFFSQEDAYRRIVSSSKCRKEDHLTIRSGYKTKILYEKIIPMGAITMIEYLTAFFLETSRKEKGTDAIILELKKQI